ncbi:MAG: surface protein [Flavipsychrobacter sp.]|nr:surface protein [Flavipsychrobacter sp.]
MRKIYLLSLLCCLSFVAMSQTTVVLTPPGGAGTNSTGSSDGVTRTDDGIISQSAPNTSIAGYSVFDLSTIPAGATIMSCRIGYYVNGITGLPSSASSCQMFGYPLDLSGAIPPAILYGHLFGFPAGTALPTPPDYGSVGSNTISTNATAIGFIQANIGTKVAITWTGGGLLAYTITGETGVSPLPIIAPPANHKPFLEIIYCSQPSITATASPNPVCENATLSLTQVSTGTDGSTVSYSWTGPSGYTSAAPNPTFPAVYPNSSGIYSVTVTNRCALPLPAVTLTASATTASVVVNPVPSAITGATVICRPGSTVLTDVTPGGTWSSSPAGIVSVPVGTVTSGTVTAITAGAVNISYTLTSTGCFAVLPFRVNNPPAAITGIDQVCQTLTTSLTETVGGGAWSSSSSTIASVVTPGTVTGNNPGSATISYTIPGCAAATYAVTVNPKPAPIAGGTNVCLGMASKFSDALGGGTWSSSAEAAFGIPPATGPDELVGVTAGTATITYTSSKGCKTTLTLTVDPTVSPITLDGGGTPPYSNVICANGPFTLLSDATPGGFWTTANTNAAVNTAGEVYGLDGGTASITYNQGSCKVFYTVTVNPAPMPISGPSPVCQNDSFFLTDLTLGDKWTSTDVSAATIDSNTGFVRTLLPKTLGMDFIYTDRVSTCAAKFTVIINPSPDGTISTDKPTTFCTGGDVTVSVPLGTLSETYQWYSNSLPIPAPLGVASSYSTTATQTLQVKITNSYGCVTNSVPVLVISGISPTLAIKGTDTFCMGNGATLTADAHGTVGIITYQWTKNGANIAGANSPTYYATTTGVYDCIVGVSGFSGTCTVTTNDESLLVHPAPTPSIGYASKKLRSDAGYNTYQWYLNTVAVAGATKSTYTPTKNGSYRVSVTDSNGCSGYSTEIIITTTEVKQFTAADVKIYPNPSTSLLHIESPVAVNAVITSIEGKTVLSQKEATEINISNLANGMYIIMLFDERGERITVQKLIKE